ncbi:MAG: hypothetical protein ACI4P8_04725 [Akkermansia sp.]
MHPVLHDTLRRLQRLFEYSWAYLGSVSAVALMLGVMSMGVSYIVTPQTLELQRLRCYAGVYNSASAEPPRGLLPLSNAPADALPLAHVRIEYDRNGLPQRMLHLDASGQLSRFPGSRIAEQRVEYDRAGRIIRKSNYDAAGQPAADASGVAVREYAYDKDGRPTRIAFRDSAGRGVVPRMPGYAEKLTTYDAQGRPLLVRHCDAEGTPITNAEGEETLEYAYDDAKGTCTRRNCVRGELRDNIHGVAIERIERSPGGRSLRICRLNAEGQPVPDPEWGAPVALHEHTAAPGVERTRYCAADGASPPRPRLAVEHLRRCDERGLPEWECYNAADGMPCVHPRLGYAERVCEYSPAGQLQSEYFWDAVGNPAPCYRKNYTRTREGEAVLSLYTDGSTEWQRR